MDAQEMKEFKQTAQQLGEAAHDLKSANEQTNKTVGEVKSELEKINEKINAQEAELKSLREAEKKSNRPGVAGANGEAAEYKGLFVDGFMRKGREDGLREKAGSLGVPEDGGYAVPEEMDRNIIELLRDESVMRQEATVIQVGSEEYKQLVNLNGAGASWVGETAARPETNTPQLAEIKPTYGEVYANPQATQKMLDDVMFNVEQWYQNEVLLQFAETENAAFTTGNGTSKPKGLFAHPTSADADGVRAFGTIQKIVSGASVSFTADDLVKLVYGLKKGYRNGAKFMMTNEALQAARLMKDSDGNYLWRPGMELGAPSTLMGYGISENEDMPDIASGALSVAFGDFKRAYKIVDVRGVSMLRDPYSNKPYVGFYSTKRVGGMLTDSNAVKALEISV